MESTNGALSFDVFIKDNNLQAMLAKDEQRIKDFARNVESNSDSITNSFDGIGKAIGGLAIGATLNLIELIKSAKLLVKSTTPLNSLSCEGLSHLKKNAVRLSSCLLSSQSLPSTAMAIILDIRLSYSRR